MEGRHSLDGRDSNRSFYVLHTILDQKKRFIIASFMRASSQMDAHRTEEIEMNNGNEVVEEDGDDEEGISNVVELGPRAEHQRRGQSMTSLLYNAVHNPNQVMAMLSNYSTSYNVVNVGIALPVLNYYLRSSSPPSSSADERQSEYSSPELRSLVHEYDIRDANDDGSNNDNDEQNRQNSLVASSLMAGMILGQLLGGILGDILGRRTAMILVMILQIGGSLGSAILVSTTTNIADADDDDDGGLTALEQLAIWRFILGVGAGGVYPLAAVMSAETSTAKERQERNDVSAAAAVAVDTADYHGVVEEREDCEQNDNDTVSSFQRIALTFSTQGLGFITVPLLAYPMLELGVDTNIIWRVLLGMGALPGIVVLYLRLKDNCGRRRTIETEEMIAVTANNTPTESLRNENDDMTATVESTAAGSDDSNERALIDNSYLGDNNDTTTTTSRRCRRTMRGGHQSRGLWESIKAEPGLATKLVGTAGTWFLFDIVFYGNALFEPVVLEAAFGSSSAAAAAAGTTNNNTDDFGVLRTVVRDSLVISCLSLPGYFITVALIGRRTCVNMCRSIRSSFSSTRFGSAMCCPPYDQTPGKCLLE